MKVAKWGNSLAVRLPKETAKALGFAEGDDITFEHTPDGEVKLRRRRDTAEWIRHLRETYKGRLPEGYRFSREDAVRRGYE